MESQQQQVPSRGFPESRLFRFLPVIISGSGAAIFLLVGLYSVWNHIQFLSRSQATTARVIGVESKYDTSESNPRTYHYPRLEFLDAYEQRHEFIGEVSRSSGGRSAWVIGSTESIRYDPANPADARLAGVWSLFPLFFLAAGIGTLVIASSLYGFVREQERRDKRSTRTGGLSKPRLP